MHFLSKCGYMGDFFANFDIYIQYIVDIKCKKIYNKVYIILGCYMSFHVKIKSLLLALIILLCVTFNQNSIFAQINTIGNFPKSYLTALNGLQKKYPNWQFVADFVPLTFEEALNMQDDLFVKLTNKQYNSWRSMRKGCYDWNKNKFISTNDGTFYGASREVIAYYLDPRNFLDEDNIFIFLDHSFENNTISVKGIENFVKGTFLSGIISDSNDEYSGRSYSEVIFDASQKTNINPLILASTILNLNGNNGSELTNGFKVKNKKVYNFYKFYSIGNTATEILYNAANFAYSQGWTTQSKAIISGAYKYFNDFSHLDNNTYYYQNFNVFDIDGRVFQISQNIEEAVNYTKILHRFYKNINDTKLVFHIPVFDSLPSSNSPLPSKTTSLNNYYLNNLEGYMLTPSFNRYVYEYSMISRGEERVYIDLPYGASLVGPNTFSLKRGNNTVKLTVKSQTGFTQVYTLKIYAYKNGTLTVVNGLHNKIIAGDTNGDEKVTLVDLANIRLHLLNINILKNDDFICADTNCDGKITTTDLENVRLHLLNLKLLN